MVRSMGLILLTVGVAMALSWRAADSNQVQAIDARAVATGSASLAGFKLLVPELPTSWRATSARLEKVPNDASKHSWHIGYVTPNGKYFAIEQSDTVLVAEFVGQWTAGMSQATAPVEEAGRSWSLAIGKADEAVYWTKTADSVVVVITANTPEGLAGLAAAAAAIS